MRKVYAVTMAVKLHPVNDDGPSQVPPSIALAWGRQAPRVRGPKPGLTLERIVAAGISVAMSEGIGALSMGRVARELGVGTMSLYRYVTAKDELLTLMVDTALGAPPAAAPGEDWRAGLTRWATGVRAAYQRHPWSLRVPISAPPLGPNNVAWLENALMALAATPLSEQQKISTVLLISGFVRNEATMGQDFAAAAAGAASGQPVPSYGQMLRALLPATGFPALEQVIASGAFDDGDDPDTEFVFGLARILDGIETLIRSVGVGR
jgi:AcrR family transcriptional regulator